MIDFRYHIVSIVAAFLALAVGIVLGSTALRGPVLANLSGNVGKLTAENQNLRVLQGRTDSQGTFAATVAPALLGGRLAGQDVDVVSMPGTGAGQRAAVVGLLGKAGAHVPAQIQLRSAFTDPRRGAEIRDLVAQLLPPGAQIPETSDAVAQESALLADVLAKPAHGAPTSPATRSSVLGGFHEIGVLTVDRPVTAPADLVVVIAGGGAHRPSPAGRAAAVPLVTQLHRSFAGVVVAGPAADSDLVGAVRADAHLAKSVSTVDNLDTSAGQVGTVLALAGERTGKVGAYGTGDGATLVPPLTR
jgi:hypothetical protein